MENQNKWFVKKQKKKKKITMAQLDKNYNEYTCISSALEQVWLLEKMAR